MEGKAMHDYTDLAYLCRRAQVDFIVWWIGLLGLHVALQAWLG